MGKRAKRKNKDRGRGGAASAQGRYGSSDEEDGGDFASLAGSAVSYEDSYYGGNGGFGGDGDYDDLESADQMAAGQRMARLEELLDLLSERSSASRLASLRGLVRAGQTAVEVGFFTRRINALLVGIMASLRKGAQNEIVLAAHLVGVMCLTLGDEDSAGQIFEAVRVHLTTLARDPSRSSLTRAAAIRALCVACFVAGEDADTIRTMRVCTGLARKAASSLKGGDEGPAISQGVEDDLGTGVVLERNVSGGAVGSAAANGSGASDEALILGGDGGDAAAPKEMSFGHGREKNSNSNRGSTGAKRRRGAKRAAEARKKAQKSRAKASASSMAAVEDDGSPTAGGTSQLIAATLEGWQLLATTLDASVTGGYMRRAMLPSLLSLLHHSSLSARISAGETLALAYDTYHKADKLIMEEPKEDPSKVKGGSVENGRNDGDGDGDDDDDDEGGEDSKRVTKRMSKKALRKQRQLERIEKLKKKKKRQEEEAQRAAGQDKDDSGEDSEASANKKDGEEAAAEEEEEEDEREELLDDDEAWDLLVQRLQALVRDSNRRRGKKERARQRATFRSVLRAVQGDDASNNGLSDDEADSDDEEEERNGAELPGGGSAGRGGAAFATVDADEGKLAWIGGDEGDGTPTETLVVGDEKRVFAGWAEVRRLHVIRSLLETGLKCHLERNPLMGGVFAGKNLGRGAAQGNVGLSKEAARRVRRANMAESREREKGSDKSYAKRRKDKRAHVARMEVE